MTDAGSSLANAWRVVRFRPIRVRFRKSLSAAFFCGLRSIVGEFDPLTS